MSEQRKVFMPDGYYTQDEDKQGWTWHEWDFPNCNSCKYRLAITEAMRLGEICEKVKVIPMPKGAAGKTAAIYILDEGERGKQ